MLIGLDHLRLVRVVLEELGVAEILADNLVVVFTGVEAESDGQLLLERVFENGELGLALKDPSKLRLFLVSH